MSLCCLRPSSKLVFAEIAIDFTKDTKRTSDLKNTYVIPNMTPMPKNRKNTSNIKHLFKGV